MLAPEAGDTLLSQVVPAVCRVRWPGEEGSDVARQDTRLETEGAEFLVLGNLLIEGIAAYKTYTNMPGYDLIATYPANHRAARIQVKSRWRTTATGFLIRSFECD